MQNNTVKVTGIIAGTVVVLALIGFFMMLQFSPVSGKTVSAQGNSEISVVPDLVSMNFNVLTSGETSQEAASKNAELVEEMIDALVAAGFEESQIKTTGYNLYEDYSWSNSGRTFLGYKASHNLILKLSTNESERIGEALDAAVKANASLAYINFELSQELENKYKAEAIKLASQDAKLKAEALAEGLDRNLGSLVSVSDSSFDYYPWMAYDAVASSELAEVKTAVTNINPSERTITARVVVVYKI